MATSETVNPPVKTESKSAKKKKAAKASVATSSPISTVPESTQANGTLECTNGDKSHESPHIRELQKNIRNINKKITNASKVDNVIAENPDKTLDQLVAARKINADQKAQILKKPALLASLAQLEEQVVHYTKIDSEFRIRSQNEKAALEKSLKEQASKELEKKIASIKAEAEENAAKNLEESLLLLSQFLKLAAIRRAEEESSELEESKALEGLLAQVYFGDASGAAAMLKLINGSDETITSVNGEDLNVTYATLKAASIAQASYIEPEELAGENESISNTQDSVQSNPAIAHASLTEISAISNTTLTNGYSKPFDSQGISQNSGLGKESVNAVPESNWATNIDLSQSQEWVEVPPSSIQAETEVNPNVTTSSEYRSWADDQPEAPSAPTQAGDGFQEIQRNRGGRGHRGGRSEGHRNRGNHRGDYRGRGRGGVNRGNRRSDD